MIDYIIIAIIMPIMLATFKFIIILNVSFNIEISNKNGSFNPNVSP